MQNKELKSMNYISLYLTIFDFLILKLIFLKCIC